MSDRELIRELDHWGKACDSSSAYSALDIRQRSIEMGRTTYRLTLVICTLMASAIMCTAWFAISRRPTASPTEIAMERTSIVLDPELLLKSIEERTLNISSRIVVMNSNLEQQHKAVEEIQRLKAKLFHLKRVAIRNQVALNQVP